MGYRFKSSVSPRSGSIRKQYSKKPSRSRWGRYEQLECRRVLATATADLYATLENVNLDIPNGARDVLANDTSYFYDIAAISSSTSGNDFYTAQNLIAGDGIGFQSDLPHNQLSVPDFAGSRWVTAGSGSDYFNATPPPVLTLDLGRDVPLDEISVWGYNISNGNGVRQFNLAFATEAEGTGGFGTSISYNPTFNVALDALPRQSFEFAQEVTARYVRFTATDNFAGVLAGGDRVGLGEIAFRIPDSATPATNVNLALGKSYSYSRLPQFNGGTFYFDEPHIQTIGAYSPGDLTDGATMPNASPTVPTNSTIVGWGVPATLDANITFDLGAASLVTSVTLGTHTWAPFANGAPDGVQVSFSANGTTFSGAESFTFTAADVPTDGHHDLSVNVTDTVARFVRLSFDGGAVLTGNTPNKWMLDEISIIGNQPHLEVVNFDATSVQGATVSVNADGSFTYDHTTNGVFAALTRGATANDSFTYTISDGATSSTATVNIIVAGLGDAPSAVDDTLVTDEASTITSGVLPAPVTHWKLDETAGSTAVDSAGTSHAAISGSVTLGDSGATVETGTSFDLSGGAMEAPHSATMNPNGSFSIEAWAKVEGGQGDYRAVISARDGSINADRRGFILYAANNNTWQFWTGAGTNAWDMVTGPAVVLDQWTHLVATFEPSGPANAGGTYTGVKTLYVNGQQVAQAANQRYEPNQNLATRIGYGANENAGDFFFNGDLDNVLIYDQALTAQQVASRASDRLGVLANDSDADGDAVAVTAVNGNPATVGTPISLPSGAVATVQANGEVTYDPNGAFENLSVGTSAMDSFTYTVTEQVPLTEGIVAQHRLDGDATDSSGSGHDGTLIGALTEPGVVGTALDFDGIDDRIDVPYSADLNPAGSFSISLWAKVEGGAGGYRSALTSRDTAGGGTQGFILYAADNNTWQFWTGQGAGAWAPLQGPAVVTDSWVHIAATFEATSGPNASGAYTGIKTLYINGAPVASATHLYAPNTQQVYRIGAGGTGGAVQYYFNGDLDEVALWNRPLSAAEIGETYLLGQGAISLSDVAGLTDTATVAVTINGLNDPPTAVNDNVATTEDVPVTSVVTYSEPFSTPAVDASAINAAYPALGAGAIDASVAGGRLMIHSGTSSVAVNATTPPGVDRTIEVDIGALPNVVGSYNVGLTVGQNSIVFHPGLPAPAGALRVEGPGGFGNTDMGFIPAVGTLHTVRVEENAATGVFTITVIDGDNPANVFTTTYSDPASIGGAISLRRSGPTTDVAIFDNIRIGPRSLLANDSDIDSIDALQAGPATTNSAQGISVTINPDGTYFYDPGNMFQSLAVGDTALDSFTYTINDGHGGTDSATVNLTIAGVNDAPVANDLNAGTTDQNTPLSGSGLLTNTSDVDTGDMLTIVAQSIASTGGGSATINLDGTFTYDPGTAFGFLATGDMATDTFTYSVIDSQGETATGVITVTITGVNDAPIAVDDDLHTDEDTVVTGIIAYTEPFDTDAADATAINANYAQLNATGIDASVGTGVLQINSGDVILPVIGNTGSYRTIRADIGANTASPGSYNVGLTIGQNNIVFHPGFTAVPGAFRVEGPGGFANTSLGFVPAVSVLHHLEVIENSATGEFTVTLTDGNNPSNVFTTTFTNLGSVGGNIGFRRAGGNSGPGLYDNLQILNGSLLDNDTDPDGDTISAVATSITSTAGAAVVINSDGTFSYDPGTLFQHLTTGEMATDTFMYTVSDGTESDTGTVTITIEGINDAPTNVTAGGPYSIAEGDSLVLAGSFTDPDTNDTRTIEWDLNGNGDFSDATGTSPTLTWSQLQALTPAINDGPASLTITFRVNDGLTTVTATTTLAIANTPPTVAIAAPSSILLATAVDFTLTPNDPSNADTAAGFSYAINWDDGTPPEMPNSVGGAPSVLSHTFTVPGTYTVMVTITDQNGDSSTTPHVIDVVPIDLVGNDLVAMGTPGADRIIFYPSNEGVRVRYNNITYPLDGSYFALSTDARLFANGLAGSDYIVVSGRLPYEAVFDGGDSNDYLAGGIANDTLIGGDANDVLLAGEGDNFIDGGDGNDRLEGRSGIDIIFGGAGNDRITGGAGNDTLDGGAGNDIVNGGLDDDLIVGGIGADTINGHYGNDMIFGNDDADQLFGSVGNDLLVGGLGGDRVRGDSGEDTVVGGSSALEAQLATDLDNVLASLGTGGLSASVQAAIDAWIASQSSASRALFEPFADDGDADDLTGGTEIDTFSAHGNDRVRDQRAEDVSL